MRLIDAEEVVKAVDKHTFETKDGLCLDDDITVILEDVPTIEERKTGKWLEKDEFTVECSICKSEWLYETHYCPHCGARMEVGT